MPLRLDVLLVRHTCEAAYPASGRPRPQPGMIREYAARPVLTDERRLRTYHAELISLRVGEYGPRLGTGLPDVYPACAECEDPLDLGTLIPGAGSEVEVDTVLDGLLVGYRHEADAHRGSLIGADDDLPFALGQDLPLQHLGPESGQARQIMRIHDDVMQRHTHDRQCASRPREGPLLPIISGRATEPAGRGWSHVRTVAQTRLLWRFFRPGVGWPLKPARPLAPAVGAEARCGSPERNNLDRVAAGQLADAGGPGEWSRMLRDPRLQGVEALQAHFVRYRYAPHWHETVCIAVVRGGAAAFDCAGHRYVAPAGSVFVIPAGEIHTGEPAAPAGLNYRVLYVDPDRIADLIDSERAAPKLDPADVVHRRTAVGSPLVWFHRAMAGAATSLEREHALLTSVAAVATECAMIRRRSIGPSGELAIICTRTPPIR
jgi:AraC-like ligand binding domain